MNFTSYLTTVDFIGLKLELPKGYKYISIDKYGFVAAWVGRPAHGDFGTDGGAEQPLMFGHLKREEGEHELRQYRSKSNGGVIYLTGSPTNFK